MRKTVKSFSPEAFEYVCRNWEQDLKEWISQLSDGSIPALRGAEWIVKKSVFLCVSRIWMERKNAVHVGHILVRIQY